MPPISRREAIALSGLTVAGFSQSLPPSKSFGQAKACILLFPYGSPPQHEMFDPKPDAPVEIQGEIVLFYPTIGFIPVAINLVQFFGVLVCDGHINFLFNLVIKNIVPYCTPSALKTASTASA